MNKCDGSPTLGLCVTHHKGFRHNHLLPFLLAFFLLCPFPTYPFHHCINLHACHPLDTNKGAAYSPPIHPFFLLYPAFSATCQSTFCVTIFTTCYLNKFLYFFFMFQLSGSPYMLGGRFSDNSIGAEQRSKNWEIWIWVGREVEV